MLLFVGKEKNTTLSTSQALTVPGTGHKHANVARIIATSQAVRYFQDGTVPTAINGHPLAVDTERWFFDNLDNLQFFEQAASATLWVEYYVAGN